MVVHETVSGQGVKKAGRTEQGIIAAACGLCPLPIVICLVLCLHARPLGAGLEGRVVDERGRGLGGVVLYDLTDKPLTVINLQPDLTEHLTRVSTDRSGVFSFDGPHVPAYILARDMEDRYSFFNLETHTRGRAILTMKAPAILTGQLFAGRTPVCDTRVSVSLALSCPCRLYYQRRVTTDREGTFRLRNMMPGDYLVQTIEEVPQVGCCFRQVATKQARQTLHPGDHGHVVLGGTSHPCLTGTIRSRAGQPLHGVWVHLAPLYPEITEQYRGWVWSDVTDPNGHYAIYDIPAGHYTLSCFRRLARNSASRVLKEDRTITITQGDQGTPGARGPGHDNSLDIVIDPEPFRPLAFDREVPAITARLLDGSSWSLEEHRGRPVILHFYTTACRACIASFEDFEKLQETFRDRIQVVGISLDKTRQECTQYMTKETFKHPQIYDGPWDASPIATAYKLVNVPASYIIDSNGRLAQTDLFGATLEKYIREKLLGD